ncbi:hypothetical protein [Peterkaempfera bronchialis]|uniref:Uncharacterized protein n=1 Tax=Peterkaempfera bronchialis TaxID=2126346 RepID=A0A345SXS6_9ACTN|nr:hypothetical protein [Peterkaempfera bronchialis]AXI78531.1 hypothetical protein C7M71_014930 [Peterkaempfera bronchialis]
MISHPVAGAVKALQKQALASRDTYQLDRIDRALDELLRNPTEDTSPAQYRMRSAMGHAYEALERRRAIAPSVPLDPERMDGGHTDARYPVVEILAWLWSEPNLADGERILLDELARGHDAASMARRHGVALPRMRERISRARRHARALWQVAGETA